MSLSSTRLSTPEGPCSGHWLAEQGPDQMLAALSEARREARLRGIPLGRWGTVAEAAALAVALCTDTTSYLTGVTLDVNGAAYIG